MDAALAAQAVVNDNQYYQESDERKVSTWVIEPSLQILRKGRVLESQLLLEATGSSNSVSDADTFLDYSARGQVAAEFGLNSIIFSGQTKKSHDPFGTLRTEGESSIDRKLDEWRQNQARLAWVRHGEMQGQLFSELAAEYWVRDYITNEAETDYLNRDMSRYSALLGYQATSNTGIFVAGELRDVQFDLEPANAVRSGKIQIISAGLRWKATAKTSGEIQIGQQTRKDELNENAFDREWWLLRLQWAPTKRDKVHASASRTFDDSYLSTADFVDTRTTTLTWDHEWTTKFTSSIAGIYRESSFIGLNDEDDSSWYQIGFNYLLDRDFSIFAQAVTADRDSTRADRSYVSNQFRIGAKLNLN